MGKNDRDPLGWNKAKQIVDKEKADEIAKRNGLSKRDRDRILMRRNAKNN